MRICVCVYVRVYVCLCQTKTRLTAVSFFLIAQTTHCNTHVLYMEATQDTHIHRPEVAVNSASAFNPFLPSARSSGQLLNQVNRPPRSGTDRRVFCSFCMSFCWGSKWRKPLVNTGRTCKLHTERPGRLCTLGRTCPPEPTAPHVGIEPMTFLLCGGSASSASTRTHTQHFVRMRVCG